MNATSWWTDTRIQRLCRIGMFFCFGGAVVSFLTRDAFTAIVMSMIGGAYAGAWIAVKDRPRGGS